MPNSWRKEGGLTAIILAGAAMFPISAQAQETASNQAIEEIVVVAQRRNQTEVTPEGNVGILGDKTAADVPFSIKSYNSALILNQQPQTLGQVLENDPSIRTTYGFGNAAEQFVIRGFALNGEDVGLDSLYGIAPRQLIAPELYDQVQVLNGSSAFLNGAAPGGSGIGGSVNVIPKRAGQDDLTRLTANYTSTGHIGGSFDVARRFDDGAFGVRLNGVARSGDVAIDNESRSTYVLGGAFDYVSGPLKMSIDIDYQRVQVSRLRQKVQIASGVIPAVPGSDHNYAQPWTYTTLRDIFGTANIEYRVLDDVLLYAKGGARDGSEQGIYDGITVVNAATGAANGSALYVPRTDNNEAAQAGLRAKLTTVGITNEVNIGGSMIWQVNRNAFDFLGGFTPFATNLYNTPTVAQPGTGFVGGNLNNPYPIAKTQLGSIFLSDTVGFWNDRILLTGGFRVQDIKVKSYSYADGSLTSEYDQQATTPVAGIVIKPFDGVSLFANRIEGLFQGPTAPIDQTVINSGQVFAPATSTQYEVGGKVALDRYNIGLAFYQIEEPSAYSVPVAGRPGFVEYGEFGKQRNRGIELSVEGEPVKGLRIITGGSVIDPKLSETSGGLNDGRDAPGVPSFLFNTNVEWDIPYVPRLTLTGRLVVTGEQKVDTANTLQIPPWTRVDLGARYVAVVWDKPLTLRFGIDNIADKQYWASAFDSFAPELLQGTPRTFKFSMSMDL